MDLYAENILDHYRAPRGKTPLPCRSGTLLRSSGATGGQGGAGGEGYTYHTESNPACGDEATVGINVRNETIADIQWDGTGCAISQAAMSMLAEEFKGKSVEIIDAFTKENMLALLGVPIGPRRLKCALLGLHSWKNTVRKAQGKTMRGWVESVL